MKYWLLLLLLSFGLGIDAFVVAIGVALTVGKFTCRSWRFATMIGLSHILFILIGYFLLDYISQYINAEEWSSKFAAAVFGFLGLKLLLEGIGDRGAVEIKDRELSLRSSFLLTLATSIDALIVGGALDSISSSIPIAIQALCIGLIAFVMTLVGLSLGCRASKRLGRWATIFGGVILWGIAVYTLL